MKQELADFILEACNENDSLFDDLEVFNDEDDEEGPPIVCVLLPNYTHNATLDSTVAIQTKNLLSLFTAVTLHAITVWGKCKLPRQSQEYWNEMLRFKISLVDIAELRFASLGENLFVLY